MLFSPFKYLLNDRVKSRRKDMLSLYSHEDRAAHIPYRASTIPLAVNFPLPVQYIGHDFIDRNIPLG